jgi:hypothetical protein
MGRGREEPLHAPWENRAVHPVSTSQTLTDDSVRPSSTSQTLRRFRLGMALLWTLAILVLCWIPGFWLNQVETRSDWFTIPNLDKVIHWSIFTGFSVLWVRVGSSRRRYLWVGLGGLALAAVTELVQNLPLIGRDGNIGDATGDLLGTLAGLAVAPLLEPMIRFVESRLFRGTATPKVTSQRGAVADGTPSPPAG